MAELADGSGRLDLGRFTAPEECTRLAAEGLPNAYTDIAQAYITPEAPYTVAHIAFTAMLSRARGLHHGIVREISQANPHSVFVLIRAYVELVTIVLYVNANPAYISTLVGIPKTSAFKRKSFEAMFSALRDSAPGLKRVYRGLSDFGHFGPPAVFNAHSITDEESHSTSWTDAPHWRDEKEFKIACAQTQELVEAAIAGLKEFAQHFLTEPFPTEVVGEFTHSERRT